jgi:hypothetical protein
MFLTNIKEEAQREINSMGMPVGAVGDNALFNSINTLSSMGPGVSTHLTMYDLGCNSPVINYWSVVLCSQCKHDQYECEYPWSSG